MIFNRFGTTRFTLIQEEFINDDFRLTNKNLFNIITFTFFQNTIPSSYSHIDKNIFLYDVVWTLGI